MKVGPHFRRARRKLGAIAWSVIGSLLFRALAASWRVETVGDENFGTRPGRVLALWHGNMLLGLRHHGQRGMHVLVSPSDDGDLAKMLLTNNGYHVIRGSASRLGSRALREMLAVLAQGKDVIVTPDGPRGPMHSMNPGPAFMARETGKPIVPIGLACNRAWRLNSWDRFAIPKFFGRVIVRYGPPILVSRSSTDEDLDAYTLELKARLLAADQEACSLAMANK